MGIYGLLVDSYDGISKGIYTVLKKAHPGFGGDRYLSVTEYPASGIF